MLYRVEKQGSRPSPIIEKEGSMSLEVDRRRPDEFDSRGDETEGFHVPPTRAISLVPPGRRRNSYSGTWAYRAAREGETYSGPLTERALAHLRHCAADLDERSPRPAEFFADPRVVGCHGGERIVHLRQHVGGIPIFRAHRAVRFDAAG